MWHFVNYWTFYCFIEFHNNKWAITIKDNRLIFPKREMFIWSGIENKHRASSLASGDDAVWQAEKKECSRKKADFMQIACEWIVFTIKIRKCFALYCNRPFKLYAHMLFFLSVWIQTIPVSIHGNGICISIRTKISSVHFVFWSEFYFAWFFSSSFICFFLSFRSVNRPKFL